MMFTPACHEPLTDSAWDAAAAREAIGRILRRAEEAYDGDRLWPLHPADAEEDDAGRRAGMTGIYLGAAGVIWAIADLAGAGLYEPARDWAQTAGSLEERYLEETDWGPPHPGLLLGRSGILLIAELLSPDVSRRRHLLELVRENAGAPEREIMWGAPGTMLVAALLHARTGEEAWEDAWRHASDILWAAWTPDGEGGRVWTQDMYGSSHRYLGPVHGFAGNVLALHLGHDLLDPGRHAELERDAVATAERTAVRKDGLANWPPLHGGELDRSFGGEPREIRVQYCHGAPGMVAALAGLAPEDAGLTELLAEGGELTWRAGPLAKGGGFCHGTAGNGYAFLKLFHRTGHELWIDRARRFAMHAIEQVEREAGRSGGRHSLWTGDPGVAVYLRSCLEADASLPTVERF